MENLEQFKAKAQTQYQIRPPFNAKFRPAEARALIEKLIPDLVRQYKQRGGKEEVAAAAQEDDSEEDEDEEGQMRQAAQKENWKDLLARQISLQSKEALVNSRKDERYKYIVQTTVGENNGQGMKI